MGSAEITPEGYVRVAEANLSRLRIQHLASAVDSTIAVPERLTDRPAEVVTGYTEWAGTWCGANVSLGWDWGFSFSTGQIFLLAPTEIRTNIQLIADNGSARPPILCRMQLAHWLETLPWRETAIRDLVQPRGNG
jgi:hypothetical protein